MKDKETANINIENSDMPTEELAADGSKSGVEREVFEPYPFDVEKISISTRQISLINIVRRLDRGIIHAADIQRRDNLWDIGKQSRLIESLMLKIPLPLFYAAETRNDELIIVDGLQRTGTIDRYINKQAFALSGLEFLRQYNGHKYEKLPEHMKIRIEETELNFVVIDPGSPPEVQRNVFKRLNTGGMPLTEQEIRHALYYGPSTELLSKLAGSREFLSATDNSIKDSRMAGQELVLRYLAFSLFGVEAYKKDDDMDAFLSDAMRAINGIESNKDRHEIESALGRNIINYDICALRDGFLLAMVRARKLFGIYAFRKSTPSVAEERGFRSPVNKSLFETWSVYLSKASETDFNIIQKKKDILFEMFEDGLGADDSPERKSIGQDSQKAAAVKRRHALIEKIARRVIEGK